MERQPGRVLFRRTAADAVALRALRLDAVLCRLSDLDHRVILSRMAGDPGPAAAVWWVAFPPIVDAALVGDPDVAVLALLVCGGGRLGPVAPFLKIYAFIPLVGERRWRDVAMALGLLAASVLVLPWGLWLSQLPLITDHLISVSGSTSVFGQPILMAIAVVAMLSLGLRRAGWLAVPLLWPYTQLHYAAISVPGLTPYLALCWCFPTPEVWLLSTCVFAVYQRLIAKSAPHRCARDPDRPVPVRVDLLPAGAGEARGHRRIAAPTTIVTPQSRSWAAQSSPPATMFS